MNVLLEKHGAKHLCKVPEGLRELCSDISREVLRSQPTNIYCFIADYVEALLMTRENAKVAVKVIDSILVGSQTIVAILYRSGLNLDYIIRVAPRIQVVFREYLEAVDILPVSKDEIDEKYKVCVQEILKSTGTSLELAETSAAIIQDAFRKHHQQMLLDESRGMIPWQRATIRTIEILKKIGVSQQEASKAAIIIQATYRGYYTRRNLKIKTMKLEATWLEEKPVKEVAPPLEPVDAVPDWLNELYKAGLTPEKANRAASIIQRAYRKYNQKKNVNTLREQLNKSMVVGAIIKNLHKMVLEDTVTRTNIPTKFGNRAELAKASEKLERTLNNRLTRARLEV